MRKTQLQLLFQNIRATKVSFISIMMFVALGIAIFLGIKWNQPALYNAADRYYEDKCFQDFTVSFPYGLTSDDISAIESLPDVSLAEGGYSTNGTIKLGSTHYVLAIISRTKKMNFATALSGTLPAKADEVGIEQKMAEATGLKVGDILTVTAKDGDNNTLIGRNFRITGVVAHPAYMNLETEYSRGNCDIGDGAVDFYVIMPPTAFDKTAFDNCFSEAYIRCGFLRGNNSYSAAYRTCSEKIADKLKALGSVRAPDRYHEMIDRCNSEIAEAQRQLSDSEKQIALAEKQIADSEKDIADTERKIADAEKEISYSDKEYAFGQQDYDIADDELYVAQRRLRKMLSDAGFYGSLQNSGVQIKAKIRNLESALQSIEQYISDLNSHASRLAASGDPDTYSEAEIAQKREEAEYERDAIIGDINDLNELLDYIEEYQNISDELSERKRELDGNGGELSYAKNELANIRYEIEKGKKELAYEKIELEKSKKEIEIGKAELDKAKKEAAKLLVTYKWTVEKRADNASYDMAKAYGESSRKLCYSMALLFVFVGVMVCYTAISRIVREQQVFAGVQKALGFTKSEIMLQYIAYAVLSVVLGSAIGGVLSYRGIEAVMNGAFKSSFAFGAFESCFFWWDFLIISNIELVLICFAAWLACHKLLTKQAVDLLRGGDPALGRTHFYEKQRWWNRCSLYTQTTVNNLVNDKTRVIATLVGVAGCTALVVMAMSLQLAIINTPERHFSDIFVFERRLIADDSPDAMKNLAAVLDKNEVSYTRALQKVVLIEKPNGDLYKADFIVPTQPKTLDRFIRFTDAVSGKALPLPETGVLLSQTYAQYHNISKGDTITLIDMKGKHCSCPVVGITTHYLSTYQVVMGPSCYKRIMGKAVVDNTFYINTIGTDSSELEKKLAETNGYFDFTDEYAKWTKLFAIVLESTSLAVYIALFLACMIAMLVLLNLNMAFINEKARELIVMRINGFSVNAVKKYIYRDNIVLTALGILIGVGVGLMLGLYVVISIQNEGDNILKEPNFIACITGIAMGALLALITNLIALGRVDKLRLSDLNKL